MNIFVPHCWQIPLVRPRTCVVAGFALRASSSRANLPSWYQRCDHFRDWLGVSATRTLALLLLFFAMALPSASAAPPQVPAPKLAEYRIAIHCSLNVLQLWRYDRLVSEYPIEVGKGGVGKRKSGDHRTPVGDYEVSWMACRKGVKGHKIVDQRSWCKDNSFIDAATGPVLEKLWADSYGGDEAAVISINYPNAKDIQRGFTGDCIHIHANKRVLDGMMKKSYGCIHMYPKDAQELYDIVDVGTPVKILP